MPLSREEILAGAGRATPPRQSGLSREEILAGAGRGPTPAVQEPVTSPQDQIIGALQERDLSLPPPGEPPAPAVIRKLREQANTVWAKQPEREQQLSEFAKELRDTGNLHTDFALDPKWGNKLLAQADRDALAFMKDTKFGDVSLLDVQGDGIEEAKGRVRNAFAVAGLVKNAPILGLEAERVYGDMVLRKVKERIDTVTTQAQSGQLDPKAQEETARLQGLYQIVSQATPAMRYKALRYAAMLDPSDPRTPTEELRQTIPTESAPLGNSPLLRWFAEGGAATRIAWGASRIGDTSAADSTKAPSPNNMLDVVSATAAILGDSWAEQLRAEQTKTRIRHNLGRLGIDFDGAGPGHTDTTGDVVGLIAGDAMKVLQDQAFKSTKPEVRQDFIRSTLEANAPMKERLAQIATVYGSDAHRKALQLVVDDALDTVTSMRARAESLGVEEVDPVATPYEKQLTGGANAWMIDIADRFNRAFQRAARSVKGTDQEANRQFEDLTGVALDKNLTYVISANEDLAASTNGFLDAWVIDSAMNRDEGVVGFWPSIKRYARHVNEIMTAIDDKFTPMEGRRFNLGDSRPEVIKNHPMFQGATPEGVQRLLSEDMDVRKIYARDTKAATEERNKRLQRLMDYRKAVRDGQPTPYSFLEYMADAGAAVLDQAAEGIREMAIVITERPEEAIAGMLVERALAPAIQPLQKAAKFVEDVALGGLVKGAGSLVGVSIPERRLSNILNGAKWRQGFERLLVSNPTIARRLEQTLKGMIDAADPEAFTDALGAAATAAKLAADEVDATGSWSIGNLKGLRKAVADVWDDIAAEPGDLTGIVEAMDGNVRAGGVFRTLSALSHEFFGQNKAPGVTLRDVIHDPGAFDAAVRSLEMVLDTGTEAEEIAQRISDLATATDRSIAEIPAAELRPLLPEGVNDIISLVDQAQKSPLTQEGVLDKMYASLRRLRGATNPEILPALKQSVEALTSSIAQRIVDRNEARSNWSVRRKRISRVLQHVQDRRKTELQSISKRGLEEIDEARAAQLPEEEIAKIEARVERRIAGANERLAAVTETFGRLKRHDPDSPFDVSQLGPITEGRRGPYLSDFDIAALVVNAPELFDVEPGEILKHRVRGKGTKKDIAAATSRLSNKEAKIEELQKKLGRKMRRELPPPAEGKKAKKYEMVEPDEAELAKRRKEIEGHQEQLRNLRAELARLTDGERQLHRVDRKAFFEKLTHQGLGPAGQERKASLRSARNAIASAQKAGLASNPFLYNALPIRRMLPAAQGLIKAQAAWQHGLIMRHQLLLNEYYEMLPDEQQIVDAALGRIRNKELTAKGARAVLKDIIEEYPGLGKYLDDPGAEGLVSEFAGAVDDNLGQLYSMMENLGVEGPVIRSFREKGYDPHLYGLYERANLIKGAAREELFKPLAEAGIKVQEPLLAATGKSLRFQRKFTDWRLVIDEPTMRYEKSFEGKFGRSRAKKWLRRRYGKNVKFRPDNEPGVEIAHIKATGDTIRLGAPLGEMGVKILDPIGKRGERMLVGISRAFRDLGVQQLFESLNTFGNLVLDEDTMRTWTSRWGSNISKTYVPIPMNKDIFGGIAGKYVHRKTLADINRAANAFDAVDHVLRGMKEMMHAIGGADSFPDQLARKAVTGFGAWVDTATGVMKQNLILLSQRVWYGNVIFNVMLDAASGAGLFDLDGDGWKSVAWAIKQRVRGQQLGRFRKRQFGDLRGTATAVDPHVADAIEGGLDVGFFEGFVGQSGTDKLLTRMTALEDLDKITAKIDQRHKLIRKLDREGTAAGPDAKKNIQLLQRDISALQIQQRELTKSWFKRFGRNIGAMFGDSGVLQRYTRDPLGRRGGPLQNTSWEVLRELYNDVDSVYKMATYHHLRTNKGWGKLEALQHVKDFAQNYRDIPAWLRPVGGKGAILSLVTSFPYEASRIFKNLALQHPTRLAAVMGMVPMMNGALLTAGGINMNEFGALLETRGMKTKTDAFLSLFDTLYIPGPGNSIATSIDLGLMNPFPNLVQNDFSPLAHGMEKLTGADTEMKMIPQMAARYFGNYLTNSPVFMGSVSTVGGIDPTTGAPLFDDRMNFLQKVAAAGKAVIKNLLPPSVPGSRAWETYNEALEAPINPRTGRPFNANQPGTVVSGQAGFRVKGKGATTAARLLKGFSGIAPAMDDNFVDPVVDFANPENVLIDILRKATQDPAGQDRDISFPVHSMSSELRKWTLRAMDTADPEVKAQAQAEMDKIIDENYEQFWKPFGRVRELSDRERLKLFQYIRDYTVEAQMNRLSVHQQTMALLEMDRTGLFNDRRMADMIQQVKFSPLGSPKIASDPGLVQQSIEALNGYLAQTPRASPRLAALSRYLSGYVLPRSKQRWQREQQRDAVTERKKAAAARIRREQ